MLPEDISHELAAQRAKIARSQREANRSGDHSAVDEARGEYRTLKLAAHIRKVVDEAPPLTPAQRDRLALLLRPERTA